MHITINTFGTRGDVQPFVALGKGLKQAGHHVLIATHRIFESFIREHGLDVFAIDLDPQQVLIQQSVVEVGNNPVRLSRWVGENFRPVMNDFFRDTDRAAQGADLLVNSALSFASWHVAEKRDLPAVAAYLQPGTPTRAFHSMSGDPPPVWLPFKGLYNYASTKFFNQILFSMIRPVTNIARREVLGLPPLSFGDYWKLDAMPIPILYAYSPSVIPKPPDWGDNVEVVGYWFLDGADTWESPSELVDFLTDGPPPVYVGFGSMVDHEMEEMNHLVVEALAKTGQRAVLLSGWSGLGTSELPDTILRIESAPHDWLFPHMAAVVHHGGAGTTAAGLRAGVPTLIVAFFGDQPFWGWRVQQLGVGPDFIPRKKLTADGLARAIERAVCDEEIRRHVSELGTRIRAEDGVARAVAFIERVAQNGH